MSALIVVGDSHARALAKGALALGYDTASFTTSAGAWRDGAVTLEKSGKISSSRFRANEKIDAFATQAGAKDPLLSGTPVVASLGFHVSQFVSDFRWHKLSTYLADDQGRKHQGLLSSRFTREFLQEQRGDMITGLSKIAGKAPLVVVVPPSFRTWPLLRAFNAELTAQIRATGVTVFDPNITLGQKNGTIPDKFKHEDGQHGNEAFGTTVLQAIAENGLLTMP